MDVEFKCPSCGQTLTVDDSEAGLELDCPSCEETITLIIDEGEEVPVSLDKEGEIQHAEDIEHAPDLSDDSVSEPKETSSTPPPPIKVTPENVAPPNIKPAQAVPVGSPADTATEMDPEEIQLARTLADSAQRIREEVAKAIVGQEDVIEQLIIAIFARSHCLLEGVPGLAKTYMIRSLSESLSFSFHRVQFTPDLMPADITGTDVIQEDPTTGRRKLVFLKGPIFAQMILADEINRSPPKTQAALLEAMQEHSVTVGGKTFALEDSFFVLATQNPVEQEGTYPLPEAQKDRFMFHVKVAYPDRDQEREIIRRTTSSYSAQIDAALNADDVIRCQQIARKVPVPDHVLDYVLDLVTRSRPDSPDCFGFTKELIAWGPGPRACQQLVLGGKVRALLHGRFHVTLDDIAALAYPVLRHRIVPTFNAEADGVTSDDIIARILEETPRGEASGPF